MLRCAASLMLSWLLVPAALAADGLTLAQQGQTSYAIVLPAAATDVERTAARELQEHLRQATAVQLPIVSEVDARPDAPQIVVGVGQRTKQLLPELNIAAVGYDGVVLKTVGQHLVLAGPPPRGTLYAVYTFLEDIVGCRWWSAQESFVPQKPTLTIPKLDVTYAPPLRYREAFYRDAFEGVFAARLKCNGHHHGIPTAFGGHQKFVGFVHTFFPLLPPDKYFAQHPEWYSEIDGKRKADLTQLCLTNEAARRELTKNALDWLRKDRQAGLISISQNDWHGRCQCPPCRALEATEGSPSGPLLRFVNAVAEDLEKEFPDVLVETLAYQYTRQPPRVTVPRKNVIVRLCSIECSFVQPLGAGPQNAPFRSDIEGWSKLAPQLFVWDYVTNFSNYLVPHPNLRSLAPNVRFFVDHKTLGLFEQGDAGSTIGDFVRLRAWLLAHLMWNPRRDEKALIREFLDGYYGPAAPHLAAYLDTIQDAAEKSGTYVSCFMTDTSPYLNLATLNQATRQFQKAAEAVAGDPVLARRVRRERLPLDHVWLMRYHTLRLAAKLQRAEFLGPADPAAACEEFIRLAHEWNVGQNSENGPFQAYEDSLRRQFRPAGPPPAECQGMAPDDWLDLQDAHFRLASPGVWAAIVDDAKASDGKAVRMPGEHFEWATSCPLVDEVAGSNPWHCYVVARTEAKSPTGAAMTMGIYDAREKKGIAHRAVKVEESVGETYRVFDLGVHNLHGGMYLWVAPPKRPGEVTAVYVDRMFLVRDKSAKK